MSKVVKGMLIRDIADRVGDHQSFLVVDVSKLDAIRANQWRLSLRKQSIHAFTVRNTLARRAFSEAGVSGLDPILEGPSTLLWGGEDIVSLSKEITKWAKELGPLEIKGGTVEGQTLYPADVVTLSKSPGREELLSIISGQVLAPGANISGALLGPGGALASQIDQVGEEGDS